MNKVKEYTSISAVYKSDNYDIFKFMLGNRGIEASRVSKIRDSITQHGFRMCPIIVNKKMEIIDGQGRFSALKQLGLPVYFVIDEEADITICRALNINQKNWSLVDYVKSYAEQGNEDYKRLLWFLVSYKDSFSQSTIIGACSGTSSCLFNGGRCGISIANGMFKFFGTDKDRSIELDYLKEFTTVLKSVGGNIDFFYGAILFAYRHTNIERRRMVEKIKDMQSTIYKVCDMEGALKLITDIYNSSLRSNRVYIDHEYKVKVTDCSGRNKL